MKQLSINQIKSSDELRAVNRERILSCMRSAGRMSRKQISTVTGLSAATVTQLTADLIREDTIRELSADEQSLKAGATGKPVAGRRGRPQVLLEFNADQSTLVVAALMLNKLDVCLFDYAGNRLHRVHKRVMTQKMSPIKLLAHIADCVDALFVDCPLWKQSLRHVALACQGVVHNEDGTLLWSPIIKARNINLREPLAEMFKVPVTVSNDCNMIVQAMQNNIVSSKTTTANNSDASNAAATKAVMGSGFFENLPDAGMSSENFAAVLLSYGVGLGLFHKGGVLTGAYSSGTEFGHMQIERRGALCRCGRYGCIEAYAADYAIWRRAEGLAVDTAPTEKVSQEDFDRVVHAALQEAGLERNAFEEAGSALGVGLSNLYAIFDPFPAVFVGSSLEVFDLLKVSLFEELRHYRTLDLERLITFHVIGGDLELIRAGTLQMGLANVDRAVSGFAENPHQMRREG